MNTPTNGTTQNQYTNYELEQIEELQHRIFTCFGNISYKDSAVVAEILYKEGWRKQSEGEWVDSNGQRVKFNPMDGCPENSCYCSACGEWLTGSNEYPCYGNYCPKCGAKMKGGAE